jgi:hypothetical protein
MLQVLFVNGNCEKEVFCPVSEYILYIWLVFYFNISIFVMVFTYHIAWEAFF